MNNNKDHVEKSLIDIREYLESMGKVTDNNDHVEGGIDNISFRQGQVDMIAISLGDDQELGKSGIKQVSEPELQKPVQPRKNNKFQIDWFNLKMIFIGTIALMFARINGKWLWDVSKYQL